MKHWILATIGLLLPISASAESLVFDSGVKQNRMVELFTSQGCNSCPPAEEYLNSLTTLPGLWQQTFPLALHVDYWDYLGWKDKFARPANSQRQRQYAREQHMPTVFTPAFFVNGKNWRPGWSGKLPESTGKTVGRLRLTLDGRRIDASFDPAIAGARLQVGILGMGLRTQIRRGENAGRHSRHEFVVLDTLGLERKESGRWQGTLPTALPVTARRYALVAWVSSASAQEPLQVTGGYLPAGLFKTMPAETR